VECLATSFGISIVTLFMIITTECSVGDYTKNGVIVTWLAWHGLTEPIKRVATVMMVVVVVMMMIVIMGISRGNRRTGNGRTGNRGTGWWCSAARGNLLSWTRVCRTGWWCSAARGNLLPWARVSRT